MGNFNRKAELISTSESEQLIWNKTGAYVLPVAESRLELSSTDAKDVIAGVGARTVNIDYLDASYRECSETVKLGDYATNKLAKGDMATVTAGIEWKNHGLHTSLNVGTGAAVFTPTAQYDGIKQDINGVAIPITAGRKYFVRAAGSVASLTKQLAVQLFAIGGTKQVETATVLGVIGVAGAGDASVVVTAAGMTGSPKTIAVAVANNDTAALVAGKIRTALGLDADVGALFTIGGATDKIILTKTIAIANDSTLNIATDNGTCTGLTAAPTSANTTAGVLSTGVRQVETATAVGTITKGGKAKVSITDKNHVGSPFDILVDVAGTIQVETATVKLDNDVMVAGGNAAVIVTCTGMTGTPKTIQVVVAGTKQAETATCVGTVTLAGDVNVTLKSKYQSGYLIKVPVLLNDDASAIALAIRTKLATEQVITDNYVVSGATDKVILTAIYPVANDALLNIAIINGTCTGVTAAATSANTTAGVQADSTYQVAAKIRAALLADADIGHVDTGFLTLGGADDKITLSTKSCVANIANLNINIADGTCDGITTAATSVNTTAGVVGDVVNNIATKIRAALALNTNITNYYDIGGSNAAITLTSKTRGANDSTLNIAITNDTCTGITAALTSANTTAGVTDTVGSVLMNFDAVATDTPAVLAAIVTATVTSAASTFAIVDTSTGDFVEITLDDIGMYELDTLTYQDKSLAELKAYFLTYLLGTETTKRTMAADIFRVNGFAVMSAGSELDSAGNISLKQVTGVGTDVYAYIEAGHVSAEQLLFTVPSSKIYTLDSIRASSLLGLAGKTSKITVKSNYNRVAQMINPVLAYVEDTSFTLDDATEEIDLGLSFPSTSDIMVVTSGDATAVINCTLIGDLI